MKQIRVQKDNLMLFLHLPLLDLDPPLYFSASTVRLSIAEAGSYFKKLHMLTCWNDCVVDVPLS